MDMKLQAYQISPNGLPLAPAGERTTISNYMAKRRQSRAAPDFKIGTLLQSKVHSGARERVSA